MNEQTLPYYDQINYGFTSNYITLYEPYDAASIYNNLEPDNIFTIQLSNYKEILRNDIVLNRELVGKDYYILPLPQDFVVKNDWSHSPFSPTNGGQIIFSKDKEALQLACDDLNKYGSVDPDLALYLHGLKHSYGNIKRCELDLEGIKDFFTIIEDDQIGKVDVVYYLYTHNDNCGLMNIINSCRVDILVDGRSIEKNFEFFKHISNIKTKLNKVYNIDLDIISSETLFNQKFSDIKVSEYEVANYFSYHLVLSHL